MLESYPVSDAHKRILKYPPKQKHCLARKELENLKNHTNTIVFLWLTNNHGFWYHIVYVKGNVLVGYILVRERWRYHPIPIQKICSYY